MRTMQPVELQRFFTSKINSISGHSPFQGKILRNKPCKKVPVVNSQVKVFAVTSLFLFVLCFCIWNSRGSTPMIRISRKDFPPQSVAMQPPI